MKRSNSQVDINTADIPKELADSICLPDHRPLDARATPIEGPSKEDIETPPNEEDIMEGRFGRKNKEAAAPDKRQTALPISGGVRRLLASRKNQRQMKYATYSPKRTGVLRNSYYDNVDDNDYPQRNGENAVRSVEVKYSQDGYIQDCDVVNKQHRKISASDITVEGICTPGSIDNALIPPVNSAGRTPSPRRYIGSNSSPRGRSNIESKARSANIPLGPGVLKSAKFIEDNAANFELASTIRLAGNHNEPMNGNFINPNRSKSLSGNHARTLDQGPNSSAKPKRSHSFNTRHMNPMNNDNIDRSDLYLEDVNHLLQDYEAHLRNIQDNSDSGFDGTLPESEACTNHSSSSGPIHALPKWRKRKAGVIGSDSGSSSGMRDAGTLTSSEGRHSQHDVDFLDSPDHKDFYIQDEVRYVS